MEPPGIPKQVVVYLATYDGQAFTRSEVVSAIDADPTTVGTALSRLTERGLVRHEGEYWAITDDRERVVVAYDLHSASERLDAADGGIDAAAWDEAAPEEEHPSERDAGVE